MKKILMCALLFAGLAVRADEDDYILYWQLAENDYAASKGVAVGYTTDGGATKNYLSGAVSGAEVVMLNAPGGTTEAIGSIIGKLDPTSYSFFVELYSDSETLWTSSLFVYNALADYISQPSGTTGGGTVPAKGVWSVSATSAVPEPTAGLLFLMGLAGLALRRRQVRV